MPGLTKVLGAVLLVAAVGCTIQHSTSAPSTTVPGSGTEITLGKRTYILHQPKAAGVHPPLVVVLHGATLSAAQTERYYHWDDLADTAGFAVAYPQGINDAWNAGSCCSDAPSLGTDDLGFLQDVLTDATVRAGADRGRLFMTGVSNGAMMTLRFECERPGQLAAIGSVAGTFTAACDHPPPVPFIAIHGLNDTTVSYQKSGDTIEDGPDIRLPAVETIQRFETADGCTTPTTATSGLVHTRTATCAEDVEVVTIDGAGHQWPGATIDADRLARDGPDNQPSTALDATKTLWSFFARQTLKPLPS